MTRTFGLIFALSGLMVAQASAQAVAPPTALPAAAPPPAYGPAITLEQAMKVVAAAEAEATKRGLKATIAIVDPAGRLVYYQRASNGTYNAKGLAMKKAISSARTKRPSKFEADRYPANTAITNIDDIFPFAGGQPILADGKVIGAIGETGGADDEVAKAGAVALK